jgi:hypothetical protein
LAGWWMGGCVGELVGWWVGWLSYAYDY